MTSKKTTAADGTTARPTGGYPGCDQLAAPAEKPGRPPEYCAGRGHTRASAWKERRRLAAEKNGATISAADDASPVTMAKVGGAELLRSLRTEADRISALGKDLRERIDVLTDPTAAEEERDTARKAAAVAEAVTGQAKQEATRAQAAAVAAQAETKRVRADAERTLTQARADNARERDELRADLRARAERAEHQADAYRAEPDRLPVTAPHPQHHPPN